MDAIASTRFTMNDRISPRMGSPLAMNPETPVTASCTGTIGPPLAEAPMDFRKGLFLPQGPLLRKELLQ
jgi:hypothetical protein